MLKLRFLPRRLLLALSLVVVVMVPTLWLLARGIHRAPGTLPELGGAASSAPDALGIDALRSEAPASAASVESPQSSAAVASEVTSAASRIVGRVFDSGGRPLAAAHVLATAPEGDLFAPSFSAVSDREGWYELLDVAPGSYDLGVRPAGVALGSTVLERIAVEEGSVAVADLALRGERTLRGGFEFATDWDDMDMSLVRVALWRKGEWGRAVARAFCFTSHAEPWRSGAFQFEGLEPGAYVLEAWPFVEEHDVWRGEVELASADATLPCRALGEDRVWRERAAVEPPHTAWNGSPSD